MVSGSRGGADRIYKGHKGGSNSNVQATVTKAKGRGHLKHCVKTGYAVAVSVTTSSEKFRTQRSHNIRPVRLLGSVSQSHPSVVHVSSHQTIDTFTV